MDLLNLYSAFVFPPAWFGEAEIWLRKWNLYLV